LDPELIADWATKYPFEDEDDDEYEDEEITASSTILA